MDLSDGLTKNWAELATEAADPRLRPVRLMRPPAEGVAWVAEVIAPLPR